MLTGNDRIKAYQLWRTPEARKRFETQTGLTDELTEAYQSQFVHWAAQQLDLPPIPHNVKLNFNKPFDWAHGPRQQQADLIRQNGVVFRWNEIEIRYMPTTESGKNIEWQPSSVPSERTTEEGKS